jgi:hypothetical protein
MHGTAKHETAPSLTEVLLPRQRKTEFHKTAIRVRMSRAQTKCGSRPAGVAKGVIQATCEEAPLLLARSPGRPGKVCLKVMQALSQAGAPRELRVDDRSPLRSEPAA